MRVPNVFPTLQAPYRIAVIGEAPGEHEENQGKPFVGPSGKYLDNLLSDASIHRDACFVGNISNYRPPNNAFPALPQFQLHEGLNQLKADLASYQPNLCLLCGAIPLHFAKTNVPYVPKKPPFPIGDWRGTLFIGSEGTIFSGYKCMATFHPAYLLRMFHHSLVVRYDLRRARTEGLTGSLVFEKRAIDVVPDLQRILDRLDDIKENRRTISVDIEGYVDAMSCLSIALSPWDVFIIPFTKADKSRYWGEAAEALLWQKLASVLADPEVPKILQNFLYDAFVLGYSYKIPVRGLKDDTMLKHWECLCPLEKSLEFQTSLYTREPYYKSTRKTDSQNVFWTYCCKDSAVTYEINLVLNSLIKGASINHYQFNKAMLYPLLYMQLKGMRFDDAGRKEKVLKLCGEQEKLQDVVDRDAGQPLNVKSPQQMKKYLYETLGLPEMHLRAQKGEDEGKVTTNYEAMLKMYIKHRDPRLWNIIQLRQIRDKVSHLRFPIDRDGRVRCSYNVVGTKTGRLSCSESATGSGTNLQTITKEDRCLFLADDWCFFFEVDLAGADGWTVAAHCAALGDPTMLDDLLYGLKIPKILALMVRHGPQISFLNRDELKARSNEVKKEDVDYFSSKQCQHGTNYGMSAEGVMMRVFLESEGKTIIDLATARTYQNLYLQRYKGVHKWHTWMWNQLQKGHLVSASGHRLPILGRKNDDATLRGALSHEPQNNTTYATNRATLALWNDKENRTPAGKLRIEPLHSVHDALCGQFRRDEAEWAVEKIRGYFNNTMMIAGIPIKIPFEGHYGQSWGDSMFNI